MGKNALKITGLTKQYKDFTLDNISLLSSASSQVKLGSLQQARYDARIDQLRQLPN